jgi:hypothetical protein
VKTGVKTTPISLLRRITLRKAQLAVFPENLPFARENRARNALRAAGQGENRQMPKMNLRPSICVPAIPTWLSNCCRVHPNEWEHAGALYDSWRRYARAHGVEPGSPG